MVEIPTPELAQRYRYSVEVDTFYLYFYSRNIRIRSLTLHGAVDLAAKYDIDVNTAPHKL